MIPLGAMWKCIVGEAYNQESEDQSRWICAGCDIIGGGVVAWNCGPQTLLYVRIIREPWECLWLGITLRQLNQILWWNPDIPHSGWADCVAKFEIRCFRTCRPAASVQPECLLEMLSLRPHPELLNQNLYCDKIPQWLVCTLQVKTCYSRDILKY